MAYRLKRIDCSDIILEPDIPRGKADIKGKFGGQNYVIECSTLQQDNLDKKLADQLFEQLAKGLRDRQLNIGIEISFTGDVNHTFLSETVKEIKQARHMFGCFIDGEALREVQFNSSVAAGRVFELTDEYKWRSPDLKGWDCIYSLGFGTAGQEGNVYSVDPDKADVSGRLFIKGLKVREQKLLHERLKKKLEDKLSQTHGLKSDVKRLFVIMGEDYIEKADLDLIFRSIQGLMKLRPTVAGLFFVDRRQTVLKSNIRYGYPFVFFINPYYPISKLNEMFERLKKLELSDIIGSI